MKIEDFISGQYAVHFKNQIEKISLLELFEENNLVWINRECSNWKYKATDVTRYCPLPCGCFTINEYTKGIKMIDLEYVQNDYHYNGTQIIAANELLS